eukprot:gene2297-2470_t
MKQLFILILFNFIFLSIQKEYLVILNEYIWSKDHFEYLKNICKEERIKEYEYFIRNRNNKSILKYPRNILEFERINSKFSLKEESDYKRRILMNQDVTDKLQAKKLWDRGITGKGIKIGVFDTGLNKNNDAFNNIEEVINFTNEKDSNDNLGHGTFVTGIISSKKEPKGFSPDSKIYSFKVFTSSQVSYTSWFLDAFNYALLSGINILNLSIGGPDTMDIPFIEKIWELSSNHIIIISAIGNDGPKWGTLMNPGDLSDVIGVGSIDEFDSIPKYSSRGITTKELRFGSGRVKPDIVTYGNRIRGIGIHNQISILSGTSVSCPVITGGIALILSSLNEEKRKEINIGMIKQILHDSSDKLRYPSIFEQGSGKFNLLKAYEILKNYKPKLSSYPKQLDLTNYYDGCKYMWPYCSQPIYYTGIPLKLNITLINGYNQVYKKLKIPKFIGTKNGNMLNINILENEIILWPFSGHISIDILVNKNGNFFNGIVEGIIEFNDELNTILKIPLKIELIKTPLRRHRILFDQYHNIQYPIGFIPRDNLNNQKDILDWNGDHIYTNYREMYNYLRRKGYFIEILNQNLIKFNSNNYGTLLMMDLEEEYTKNERNKLYEDVSKNGLSLIIIGQWYNRYILKKIKFFDDNTHKVWFPLTGGSNLPALNGLLSPFGISFGNKIYDGEIEIKNNKLKIQSSTSIIRFPKGGMIVSFELQDKTSKLLSNLDLKEIVPLIGFSKFGKGRISIFCDSNPFESNPQNENIDSNFYFLERLLEFTSKGIINEDFKNTNYKILKEDEFIFKDSELPERIENSPLLEISLVNKNELLNANSLPIQNDSFFIGRKLVSTFKVKLPSGKILIPSLLMFIGLSYFIYIFTRNLVVRERRYSI